MGGMKGETVITTLSQWVNRLGNAVSLPTDTPYDRTGKLLAISGNFGGWLLILFYGILYLAYNLILASVFCAIYVVLGLVNFIYFFRTKGFQTAALVFSILLFLVVGGVHVSLGGFAASGAVIAWQYAPAIVSLLAGQRRIAILWLLLYLGTLVIFGFIDPWLIKHGPNVPQVLNRALFGLNLGLAIAYSSIFAFYYMFAVDAARARADDLLLNILPGPIAERLKANPATIADGYQEVTVLFADIVDFTSMSAEADPVDVVNMLNDVFSDFDELATKHGLEKIKTIGDAYMVAGGLPEPREDHCEAVMAFAVDMLDAVSKRRAWDDQPIRLRVGINTGPVVAGVIGRQKFIYDLWGDAVNTASRMESNGLANVIQVTKAVKDKLGDRYSFEEREPIHIKGKGGMVTYLLHAT